MTKNISTTLTAVAAMLLLTTVGCNKNDDSDDSDSSNLAVETIVLTTDKKVGETIDLAIYADPANMAEVWIDLNNNGKKDKGEDAITWAKHSYQLGSGEITIHGKITILSCGDNELTAISANSSTLNHLDCRYNKLATLDTRKLPALSWLSCDSNKLTTMDLSRNPELSYFLCYDNAISGAGMDRLVRSLPQKPPGIAHAQVDIINLRSTVEKNVCTKAQVKIATQRGWGVTAQPGGGYPGS